MGPPAALSRRETKLRYGRSWIMNILNKFVLRRHRIIIGYREVLMNFLRIGKAIGILEVHNMECIIIEFG